jgi:hypothetical protein
MRTTLNIDDDLIREAKIAAIREGITLTEYIERALKHKCSQGTKPPRKTEWTFTPVAGQPIPGFPWRGSLSEMLEFVEGFEAAEGVDADS